MITLLNKRYTRTTPFLLLSAIGFIVLLYQLLVERGGPDGWLFPIIIKMFVSVVVIAAADMLFKYFIKQKTWRIWVIELLLCLGFVYYWIVS